MRFARPVPRRYRENVVPMINVVFLLLIFFMMSSELGRPAPIDVTVPQSERSGRPEADAVLFLAADGTIAFGDVQGASAVDLARSAAGDGELLLMADQSVYASRVSDLLARLAQAGVRRVSLGTRPATE